LQRQQQQQQQQQRQQQPQHPAQGGPLLPHMGQGSAQPRSQQPQPVVPPGLQPPGLPGASLQSQQQQQQRQQTVLYRLQVTSPEAAARLVSASTKHKLHQGATGIYLEHWLTPSQVQARRNLRPLIQQLQQQHTQWRWSLAHPTQLQQHVLGPDRRWRWQAVYPPPPPTN
jgi:hypothetical protein